MSLSAATPRAAGFRALLRHLGRVVVVLAGAAGLLVAAQYAGRSGSADPAGDVAAQDIAPTRAVRVEDVLQAAREGRLRAPSRPHNDFPGRRSYAEAFPEGEPGVEPAREIGRAHV